MVEQGFELLWRASLLFSGACLFVMMLRFALVRLGAWFAYASWLLVPLLLFVHALPQWTVVPMPATIMAWRVGAEAAVTASLSAQSSFAEFLFGLWVFGVLIAGAVVVRQHLRYTAQLRWIADSSHWRAADARGPALLGLFRPRLVLPNNFEAQFDDHERAMILAHEEVHRRREDNLWNAIATTLVALQWFNPFAYLAWRRMRLDQELACDAAVMQRYPQQLALYARALLKAQDASLTHSVICTWKSRHPLIERISMLAHYAPSKVTTIAGNAILLISGLIAAGAVYAAQGVPLGIGTDNTHYKLELKFQLDGKEVAKAKLVIMSGKPATVIIDNPAVERDQRLHGWEIQVTPKGLPDNNIELNAVISFGSPPQVIARPRLIVLDGTPAAIQLGTPDGLHTMRMNVVSHRVVKAD